MVGTGGRQLLECEIASGTTHLGDLVYLSRLTLTADPDMYPFKWTRRQFPVRAAFALTINKAQGQTLRCVGIYLPNDCFAHGQLYVAASRVGHRQHLRFALQPDLDGAFRTKNVVYREVLT